MREIPKKNYVILAALTVFVVGLVFVSMNLYNKYGKEEYVPIIKEVISEINYDDLDSYILDNPNAILYINDSNKKNSKLEKEIKNIIVNNNLQQTIVYIEKNKRIKEKYDLNNNNPIFILYKDGKVKEILSEKKSSKDSILDYLDRNGIIDND